MRTAQHAVVTLLPLSCPAKTVSRSTKGGGMWLVTISPALGTVWGSCLSSPASWTAVLCCSQEKCLANCNKCSESLWNAPSLTGQKPK